MSKETYTFEKTPIKETNLFEKRPICLWKKSVKKSHWLSSSVCNVSRYNTLVQRNLYNWKKTYKRGWFICRETYLFEKKYLWKRPTDSRAQCATCLRNNMYIKRELCMWNEACERNLLMCKQTCKKVLYIWKETYKYAKRLIYMKRDLYIWKNTCIYKETFGRSLMMWKQTCKRDL